MREQIRQKDALGFFTLADEFDVRLFRFEEI
jgi:hypothetical protein